jgi:hypothetical protein
VLSLLGGLFGLALGVAAFAPCSRQSGSIPRIGIDVWRWPSTTSVLAFTAFVSVLTGLVFGLFPALRAARVDLSTVAKESAGRSVRIRQNKTRRARDHRNRARADPMVGAVAHSHLHRAACRRSERSQRC